MAKPSARLLYVVNHAGFFLSHRLSLAQAAQAAGYDVHIATPAAIETETIRAEGFPHHPVPLSRRGVRVWEEALTLRHLYRLYRTLNPDLVHHVTIKPVLYGGMMARLAHVPAAVYSVTGLGHVFVANGLKVRLLRQGVKLAYRLALGHPNARVIFQNPDDRALFVKNHLVDESKAVLIKGAGVNMSLFSPCPETETETPLVLFASRMLWSKGVGEFVEAARRLREAGVTARFVLVGDVDPDNPASVPAARLEAWRDGGAVEWWGHRNDMAAVFAQSHLVCVPSYGEGVPKVLIEAAACGRAIVTADVPGCREIVRHGENGLLAPVRDAGALAERLRQLIEDPALRRRMGVRSRSIAEAEFSLEQVVRETLAVYRELL
jgi:glycosyltransferase involved in cell wall biosynthesis